VKVLSSGDVRARKRYRCSLCCDEWIESGEVHHRQGVVGGDGVGTFRAHLHCYALSAWEFGGRIGKYSDGYLAEIANLELDAWSREDIDKACDAMDWPADHPSREQARALWQRFHEAGAPRMRRLSWGGGLRPGTALEVRR